MVNGIVITEDMIEEAYNYVESLGKKVKIEHPRKTTPCVMPGAVMAKAAHHIAPVLCLNSRMPAKRITTASQPISPGYEIKQESKYKMAFMFDTPGVACGYENLIDTITDITLYEREKVGIILLSSSNNEERLESLDSLYHKGTIGYDTIFFLIGTFDYYFLHRMNRNTVYHVNTGQSQTEINKEIDEALHDIKQKHTKKGIENV